MRNAEFVRNVRINPVRDEAQSFSWGVDIAIPHSDRNGFKQFNHLTGNGVAESFDQAHKDMVAYIESV